MNRSYFLCSRPASPYTLAVQCDINYPWPYFIFLWPCCLLGCSEMTEHNMMYAGFIDVFPMLIIAHGQVALGGFLFDNMLPVLRVSVLFLF